MKRLPLRRQRGAALLTAMLTVALVATFAAASLWQQWRSIEVETAERARIQSEWLLTGALDWSRLLLREDARAGGADHLGEPWAVPLQEARLSSFLAADRNNSADTGEDVLDAFLSGQIRDMQSLLNINNLLDNNGKISEPGLRTFSRLFDLLGLPPEQLAALAENLRAASATGSGLASTAALVPRRVEQLVWLGLPPETIAALQPYVTILPRRDTKVNLNTASAEVIYAVSLGLSMAEAQQLVAERERSPFLTVAAALKLVSAAAMPEGQAQVAVASQYFEVRARLRLDQLVVEERALLHRDGTLVTTEDRERGMIDPGGAPPATPR
jgi:general secretion pathway protein K